PSRSVASPSGTCLLTQPLIDPDGASDPGRGLRSQGLGIPPPRNPSVTRGMGFAILRNMRTPLVAGLIGILFSVGCVNSITGVGDDDDGSGSGSGSGSDPVDPVAARVDISVDKTTI